MKKRPKRKVSGNRVVRGSGNVFLDLGFGERGACELQAKAQRQLARMKRRLAAQDRGDIAEATRRRGEMVRPYSELRKEVGLM